MNLLFALNLIIIAAILFSAWLAVTMENLLSSIVAVCACGIMVAVEFILLAAPDVALAEAAVGAVLSAVIFIVGLRKIKPKEDGQ